MVFNFLAFAAIAFAAVVDAIQSINAQPTPCSIRAAAAQQNFPQGFNANWTHESEIRKAWYLVDQQLQSVASNFTLWTPILADSLMDTLNSYGSMAKNVSEVGQPWTATAFKTAFAAVSDPLDSEMSSVLSAFQTLENAVLDAIDTSLVAYFNGVLTPADRAYTTESADALVGNATDIFRTLKQNATETYALIPSLVNGTFADADAAVLAAWRSLANNLNPALSELNRIRKHRATVAISASDYINGLVKNITESIATTAALAVAKAARLKQNLDFNQDSSVRVIDNFAQDRIDELKQLFSAANASATTALQHIDNNLLAGESLWTLNVDSHIARVGALADTVENAAQAAGVSVQGRLHGLENMRGSEMRLNKTLSRVLSGDLRDRVARFEKISADTDRYSRDFPKNFSLAFAGDYTRSRLAVEKALQSIAADKSRIKQELSAARANLKARLIPLLSSRAVMNKAAVEGVEDALNRLNSLLGHQENKLNNLMTDEKIQLNSTRSVFEENAIFNLAYASKYNKFLREAAGLLEEFTNLAIDKDFIKMAETSGFSTEPVEGLDRIIAVIERNYSLFNSTVSNTSRTLASVHMAIDGQANELRDLEKELNATLAEQLASTSSISMEVPAIPASSNSYFRLITPVYEAATSTALMPDGGALINGHEKDWNRTRDAMAESLQSLENRVSNYTLSADIDIAHIDEAVSRVSSVTDARISNATDMAGSVATDLTAYQAKQVDDFISKFGQDASLVASQLPVPSETAAAALYSAWYLRDKSMLLNTFKPTDWTNFNATVRFLDDLMRSIPAVLKTNLTDLNTTETMKLNDLLAARTTRLLRLQNQTRTSQADLAVALNSTLGEYAQSANNTAATRLSGVFKNLSSGLERQLLPANRQLGQLPIQPAELASAAVAALAELDAVTQLI